MENRKFTGAHPGRVIIEEFLAPRGISVWHLARDLGVTAWHLYEIVQGQRSITADIACRLAHYFGLSERFWLKLQEAYDLESRKALSARCAKSDLAEFLDVMERSGVDWPAD